MQYLLAGPTLGHLFKRAGLYQNEEKEAGGLGGILLKAKKAWCHLNEKRGYRFNL